MSLILFVGLSVVRPRPSSDRFATDAVIEDPLFSGTVSREDRERLREALPERNWRRRAPTRTDEPSLLVPYVEAWQERSLVVDGHPETIALTVLYAACLPCTATRSA